MPPFVLVLVRRRSARTLLLYVLALALWTATTLGMLHRSLHLPHGMAPVQASHAGDDGRDGMGGRDGDGGDVGHDSRGAQRDSAVVSPGLGSDSVHSHGLGALFGDHTDAECRLYDQLSHGPAALCVPPLVLPMLLPAATFAWLEGEALARWVALFDARGPPSIR